MSPERWREIERLYYSAIEQEPRRRQGFLAEACGADSDLHKQVDNLLVQLAQSGSTSDLPDLAEFEWAAKSSEASTVLEVGSCLGPYQIVGLLGAGGMGKVYGALDTRLDRAVAVKISAGKFTTRFESEARTISTLNHPNICTLYDVGTLPSGAAFMVTELVEGETLRDWLKRSPGLERSLEVIRQVIEALRAAHDSGIIHGDLKPANIMVRFDGYAKVLDFGLAKRTSGTGAQGPGEVILGTIACMSPEQILGRETDARSDIFALGIILYEVVAGRHPWPRKSPFETMYAILHDDIPPAGTPGTVIERILRRSLSKNAELRFQKTTELAAAIQEISTQASSNLARNRPSIAVLPFTNMSADKENEYFGDGLAEEIINTLGQVAGLKVTARTSAFAFRDNAQDIGRIADALGVATILLGSVRRAGGRIRVSAQLINAADGSHLWSERYDRDLSDVFAIQDEVAQAITSSLQMRLTTTSTQPVRYTPKVSAWEACVKARYHMGKSTPEGMVRAQENCEEAIALDPGYALPWVHWSAVVFLSAGSGITPAHEAMPLARAKALQAVDIDPGLPEAHSMLAVIAGRYDYNWEDCARQFHLAMAHAPVPLEVRRLYAFGYLLPMGRIHEAIEELRNVILHDPLMLRGRMELEICLTAIGRLEEAEVECRKALELDDQFYPAHLGLARNLAARDRTAEALAAAERAYALAPWQPVTIGLLAGLLAREGQAARANELIHKLRPGDGYGAPIGLTYFHALQGDVGEAANWYERAIDQRDPRSLVAFYLLGENFRLSPRWRAVAATMNLPRMAT